MHVRLKYSLIEETKYYTDAWEKIEDEFNIDKNQIHIQREGVLLTYVRFSFSKRFISL